MHLAFAFAALAIASLLYVFWVTPEKIRQKSRLERERDFLAERKEMVYEGLRDLQMEYRMGKLSDSDYQELKLTFQHQLAALIEEADQLQVQPEAAQPETVQPKEVAAASLGHTEAPIPGSGHCASCGRENPEANRFCGACGSPLPDRTGVRA